MKPPHKYASDPTSVHWLNSAFHEVNFSVNKPLSLHISMHQCSEYILLITFSAFVLKYDLIHLIHEARFYIHVLVFLFNKGILPPPVFPVLLMGVSSGSLSIMILLSYCTLLSLTSKAPAQELSRPHQMSVYLFSCLSAQLLYDRLCTTVLSRSLAVWWVVALLGKLSWHLIKRGATRQALVWKCRCCRVVGSCGISRCGEATVTQAQWTQCVCSNSQPEPPLECLITRGSHTHFTLWPFHLVSLKSGTHTKTWYEPSSPVLDLQHAKSFAYWHGSCK